ncbi:MAG: IS200/IS605 family transposase, partial [Bacteroidetes bacterium]|nr:IS200/IS605 family transposase [Bacteroidota bacterium]
MDEHIYKSHNKTLLLYHMGFPAKYRRKVFTQEVEESLKEICVGIEKRYEIRFVEIGLEENHVHLLVQGIPTLPVSKIVTLIKSLTAREIFKRHPRIRREILWGGALWTSGYYANTVGLYASKDTIKRYIQNQGN